MKVNVKGLWFDAEVEPIAISLSDDDKKNIANMSKGNKIYITYPLGMDFDYVEKYLRLDELKKENQDMHNKIDKNLLSYNVSHSKLIIAQHQAIVKLGLVIRNHVAYTKSFGDNKVDKKTQDYGRALKNLYKGLQRGLNYYMDLCKMRPHTLIVNMNTDIEKFIETDSFKKYWYY